MNAFIVCEEFIGNGKVALIIGDNIFYGYGFTGRLENVVNNEKGVTIFGYHVNNPLKFGAVEFDNEKMLLE